MSSSEGNRCETTQPLRQAPEEERREAEAIWTALERGARGGGAAGGRWGGGARRFYWAVYSAVNGVTSVCPKSSPL